MASNGPPSSLPRSAQPGWVGQPSDEAHSPTALEQAYERLQAQQAAEIRQHGGPEAFVRAKAGRLLRLYRGPWTQKFVTGETTAAWEAADARLAQCDTCPPHGGACRGSMSVVPEGHAVELSAEGFRYPVCSRWALSIERRRFLRAGIPEAMLDWPLERLFGGNQERYPVRQELLGWLERADRAAQEGKTLHESLLITGGTTTTRTRLAIAIARELVRTGDLDVRYTFGPRLATELKEYFQAEGGSNAAEICEEASYLVFDYLDPKPLSREPWKEWFVSRVDELMWKRLSSMRPTVMVSRMRGPELFEHLSLSSPFSVQEIDISLLAFGPLSAPAVQR